MDRNPGSNKLLYLAQGLKTISVLYTIPTRVRALMSISVNVANSWPLYQRATSARYPALDVARTNMSGV